MKIFKRILAAVMCLALIVLMMPGVKVSASEAKKLSVGDRIEGFRLESISENDIYCAKIYEFTHERTGAKAVYIDNGSINRLFSIAFHCPADGDKGTTHIIEHLIVNGSEKYPVNGMINQLLTKSFSTFANAQTDAGVCFYPIGSLSEEQLLKFEDLYVDAVFNPIEIKDDPTGFMREGFRYEFDENGDLICTGIVYSEVQAMLSSISNAAYMNFYKLMTGDGVDAGNHGGDPDHIPELTFEELKAYHDKYYVPSNSASFFVGSFDSIAPFLKVLDEAFEPYSDEKVVINDEGFRAPEKFTKKIFEFPVYEGTDVTNGATMLYGVLTDKDSNVIYLDNLATYLNSPASELKMLFLQKLPQASVNVAYETRFAGNALIVSVSNVNKSDSKKVKKIINKSFRAISENGFNPLVYDKLFESMKLNAGVVNENSDISRIIAMNASTIWGKTDDAMLFFEAVNEQENNFAADFENGAVLKYFKENILNNKRKALAVTVPVPGLAEKKAAENREKLAKIKENLSEDEIKAIRETAKRLQAGSSEESTEFIDLVNVTTPDNLKYESKDYNITDETDKNGIRFIEAEAGAEESISANVLIDLGGLSEEALPYLGTYIMLLDQLDSQELSKDQIYLSYASNMVGGSISNSVYSDDSERGYTPYLSLKFSSIAEKLPDVYYTFEQSVKRPDFSNLDRIKSGVSAIASNKAALFSTQGFNYAYLRSISADNDLSAYYEYVNGLSFHENLNEILLKLESDPEEVIEKLSMIRDYFNDDPATVVMAAGGKKALEENRNAISVLLGEGKRKEAGKLIYSFPKRADSEAIVAETDVNYNILGLSNEDLGFDTMPAEFSVISKIVDNGILYPILRVQNGSYSYIAQITDEGISLISYRDPMIQETFDAYAQIPEFLKQVKLSKSQLDVFKLLSLSSLMMPKGEMTDALEACKREFAGTPADSVEKSIEAIKAMKPKNIRKFAKYFENLSGNGRTITIASRATVEANKDRFDSIVDIYGVK